MNSQELMDSIKEQAGQRVIKSLSGDESDKTVQGHIALEMLNVALRRKDTVESALRSIVVDVSRSGYWAFCRPEPNRWPNGFTCMDDFIDEAVLMAETESRNVKSRLVGLATVATFADQNSIDIDAALENWSGFRTCLPALKAAVSEADADELEAIIEDIESMSQTELAKKYSKSRQGPTGVGKVQTMDTGEIVLIAVVNNEADRQRLVAKLGGALVWGLDAQASIDQENNINVRIPMIAVDETLWVADKQAV
jgi:hypothetical protein